MIRWGTYKSLNKYLIGTSGSKLREGDYAPPQCFDIPTNCHSAWENVTAADIGWLLSLNGCLGQSRTRWIVGHADYYFANGTKPDTTGDEFMV